jgi:hypothetical protein
MVHTVILSGGLDAHHVSHALHNANRIVVPARVRADAAQLFVGHHVTFLAIMDLGTKVINRRSEMVYVFGWLPQKMQGKPESASGAYSGKRTDGLDGLLQDFGRIFVHIYMQK